MPSSEEIQVQEAAQTGKLDVLQSILSNDESCRKKPVENTGYVGYTPLLLARNYPSEFNAQMNAVNDGGNTALHIVGVRTRPIQEDVHQNYQEFQARIETTAKLLIDLGADKTIRNSERCTAAEQAQRNGNKQLAKVICTHVSSEALFQERAIAEQQRVDALLAQGRAAYNEQRYIDAASI